MDDLMLKVEHVSKEYRLGTIGGGTLKAELQSKFAKLRHKEDPNLKIGEKAHEKNERFLALDDVNFEIKKGERIGIIGHNGAGKSTVLKLICRVTAPSKGNIYLNGRITSMLEVGTGFHNELTGRENIYLNGAILGMSKAEVDKKFDEIVEFSEIGQFIDTPIKRYSSGMKVKLGFAVASHLESEIMIMDEVLAVGDVNFQNKCIEQMKKVAEDEGRTILYVSHNMATIRNLCTRCIVLDHGKVVYDGDTEGAITVYMKNNSDDDAIFHDTSEIKRPSKYSLQHKITSIELLNHDTSTYEYGDVINFRLKWNAYEDIGALNVKAVIYDVGLFPIGQLDYIIGKNQQDFSFDTKCLVPGKYKLCIKFYTQADNGNCCNIDEIQVLRFNLIHNNESTNLRQWFPDWGKSVFDSINLVK